MAKDYYKILGVEKGSSKEEIKKAYKQLAKKYHPDLNKEGGSSDKFKEINEAASVLGDDTKRQQYDQFGTTAGGFSGAGMGGFDFSDFMGGSFDFGDIFDQVFGGGGTGFFGRRKRGPARGSDLRYDMEVTLEDVAFGTSRNIVIPRMEKCERCDGTGAQAQSDIENCGVCNGTGVEKKTQRTPFGLFQSTTTCSRCGGEGKIIKDPCAVCDGNGRVKKTRKLEIKIPAGAETGTKLRISGEGEAGEKGAGSGDLYVVLFVEEHDTFERDGNDLYIEVPVSFAIAALGGETEVPTLKGKAKLKIPAGTQSNTVFRMKGKGIPSLRGYGTGSQNVKVNVEVPKKLSKKQKDLLKEFEKGFKGKKRLFGL